MSAAAPAELVTKMLACRFGSGGGHSIGTIRRGGGGGGARVSGFGIRDVEDLDRCSNQPLQFSELMMRTRLSRYSFASTVELSVPACRCA